MRLYLLLVVAIVVPIALSYGVAPASVLPKTLDITVTGVDQIHIFRVLMCLYLGAALFWAIAAFTPAWQRTAVIWVIFFTLSLAVGRAISLLVDGPASALLVIYLVVEILRFRWLLAGRSASWSMGLRARCWSSIWLWKSSAASWGLAVLVSADRKLKQ
jgi:hypothetical protein